MWILVFSFESGRRVVGAGREGSPPEGTLPSRAPLMRTRRQQPISWPGLMQSLPAGGRAGRKAAWAVGCLTLWLLGRRQAPHLSAWTLAPHVSQSSTL